MPIKKKIALPKPKCHVPNCTEDAVYGFRRIIDTTNLQSSAREFTVDPFNCCEGHEEEVSKDYSGPNVKKVNLKNGQELF